MDALAAGPSLRFITTERAVDSFYGKFREHFRPFILSGSGDFHHLTAVFVRQVKEPFAILSFDNHPDWDVRPPHWSCGAWVNRALENPLVQQVAVWGCGSFECEFPVAIARKSVRLPFRSPVGGALAVGREELSFLASSDFVFQLARGLCAICRIDSDPRGLCHRGSGLPRRK